MSAVVNLGIVTYPTGSDAVGPVVPTPVKSIVGIVPVPKVLVILLK